MANPGNFVFRCVSLLKTRFGGVVPPAAPGTDEATAKFMADVTELVGSYVATMEKLELRDALRASGFVFAFFFVPCVTGARRLPWRRRRAPTST